MKQISRSDAGKLMQRLVADAELRAHVLAAFRHGRNAYRQLELSRSQAPAKQAGRQLAKDKQLQAELKGALAELRSLAGARAHKRRLARQLAVFGLMALTAAAVKELKSVRNGPGSGVVVWRQWQQRRCG